MGQSTKTANDCHLILEMTCKREIFNAGPLPVDRAVEQLGRQYAASDLAKSNTTQHNNTS